MRPLVPVLLYFISGIIFVNASGISYAVTYTGLAASFLLALISLLSVKRPNYFLIAPIFFFLGALSILPSLRPSIPPDHIKNFIEEADSLSGEFSPLGVGAEGIIETPPELVKGKTRFMAEAKRLLKGDEWIGVSGAVSMAVNGEVKLKRGDYVRFISSLKAPSNYGNPGEFDYKGWLSMRSIFVTGFVKDERLITKLVEGGSTLRIDGIRESIRDFIDSSGLRNSAPLKSLIISTAEGLSPDVWEAFRKTGTAHILSISGLHVGIVAVFFYKLFLLILRRSETLMLAINIKKAATALTIAPVIFYGLLAGFPVPTQRAVIMVVAFVAAFYLNRGKDYFNTLALSALLILALYPYSLWDASFQLSFAAVFFILLIARDKRMKEEGKDTGPIGDEGFLKRVWEKRIMPLRKVLLVTLAAGIGTAPILAYHFHMVSLTGIAANLVAVPLSGIIIPLLLVSASIYPFWAGLAKMFLIASDALFSLLVWAIKLFSSLPYSSIRVTTPTVLEIALYYGLVISLANVKRGRRYAYIAASVFLAMLIDWGWWGYYAKKNNALKATFISVGQGESVFIEFPGNKTMLIDGGGIYGADFDIGESVIAPFLWSKKIKNIDYMVLSHTQLDHMGGLKFIAGNFNVGEFWWNGDGELGELGEVLGRKDIKIKAINSPALTGVNGVIVEALHPAKGIKLDANDMSLVLRLGYGDFSLLLTGDITDKAEAALLKKDIRATVLKAPHHGSKYSSSEGFLKAVRPEAVLISAGRRNPFGFPHKEALGRYKEAGAKVFRTDTDGAITLEADKGGYNIRGYLTDPMR